MNITPAHVMQARRELARDSLRDYACMIDIPTAPITDLDDEDTFSTIKLDTLAAHHALICDKLQDVADGKIQNLMLLLPPGSAKSTFVDVVFIPWYMARFPRRNVGLGSYATGLARKQGRRARQVLRSKAHRNLFPGVELTTESSAADEFKLTTGGEFMAGGLLSGITGNRFHLGVLDDPIAGRDEAESDTIRSKTWDAYIDDFCSRLTPGAPQVMILTRWHMEDPAGKILPKDWNGESGVFEGRDGRTWEVLCIPAICDRADDPLGRKIGEGLWPEWFPMSHWEPFKKNARTWYSLYQQKPAPQEGSFFLRSDFRRFRLGDEPRNLKKYLTSDHAPTEGVDSDPNVARVWGLTPTKDIYMLDGFNHVARMDKTAQRIIDLIKKHEPFAWFPEDDNNYKAASPFIVKMMKDQGVFTRIAPISPHGHDKAAKAQSFQGMAAMGCVWVPEGPEGDAYIEELIKFPAGAHDEEVDVSGLIGRAIAMAHPALAPEAPPTPPQEPQGIMQMTMDQLMAQMDRQSEGRDRV